MNLFISGWAGFREALGDIPEDWYFINPFLDLDEREILDFLKDKSGDTVVGWSTGGHIILKNLKFFFERYEEIIVIAGFKKFTHYVSPRIIKRMIQKMGTEPDTVVKSFLTNAGCKPLIPDSIDFLKLTEGLEFLLYSEVKNSKNNYKYKNLTLIHGTHDKILPIKALEDLTYDYPFAKTYIIKKPHWISFEEIMKIRASSNA